VTGILDFSRRVAVFPVLMKSNCEDTLLQNSTIPSLSKTLIIASLLSNRQHHQGWWNYPAGRRYPPHCRHSLALKHLHKNTLLDIRFVRYSVMALSLLQNPVYLYQMQNNNKKKIPLRLKETNFKLLESQKIFSTRLSLQDLEFGYLVRSYLRQTCLAIYHQCVGHS